MIISCVIFPNVHKPYVKNGNGGTEAYPKYITLTQFL